MTMKRLDPAAGPEAPRPLHPFRRGVLPDPDAAPDIADPLPDAALQGFPIAAAFYALFSRFEHDHSTLVCANGPIYGPGDGGIPPVLPDVYVAFGVDIEAVLRRNGYFLDLVGKAPDFVLEIASPATCREDPGAKRGLYAGLGAREYWRYDKTGGDCYGAPLAGDALVDGEYRPLDVFHDRRGRLRGRSVALGLDLCWTPECLRFIDPETEEFLPAAPEWDAIRRETESARQAAESARREAELARQEAESARREAESARQIEESARQAADALRRAAEANSRVDHD